jgi:hypothetical protein
LKHFEHQVCLFTACLVCAQEHVAASQYDEAIGRRQRPCWRHWRATRGLVEAKDPNKFTSERFERSKLCLAVVERLVEFSFGF